MKLPHTIVAVQHGMTVAADSLYLTRGQSCPFFYTFFVIISGVVPWRWIDQADTPLLSLLIVPLSYSTTGPDPGDPGKCSQIDTYQNRVCLQISTAPAPSVNP
jgi:hypothetical protein